MKLYSHAKTKSGSFKKVPKNAQKTGIQAAEIKSVLLQSPIIFSCHTKNTQTACPRKAC
jgi:hypothetical protein